MDKFSFKIKAVDKKTGARLGVIHTAHGDIQTPAFVPVGTQATVKSVSNEDLGNIGTQIFFVNTYHLYLRPGLEIIKKFNGLHNFIGWNKPIITDSAGFQIFSLGDVNWTRRLRLRSEILETALVRINDAGVFFRSHLDGSEHLFTPEKSIEAQRILGSDLTIAFDECTYYPATHDYANLAMGRTHRWALRCLATAQSKTSKEQALYGVIQGGVFKDLRQASVKYIASLPFEGIAIGGVSVGESKEEMKDVLGWVTPLLPEEKPRHLLGVGEIDDIFTLIERGIDSFDCVMPSRLARMGNLLVKNMTIDIMKGQYAEDKNPIDKECECFVCKNYHRAYLNHLFKTHELLAYRLATFHNLFFMENLTKEIRNSIKKGSFLELKTKWLAK